MLKFEFALGTGEVCEALKEDEHMQAHCFIAFYFFHFVFFLGGKGGKKKKTKVGAKPTKPNGSNWANVPLPPPPIHPLPGTELEHYSTEHHEGGG